eukprot:2092739-Pyramimonas_sp.AAC.1
MKGDARASRRADNYLPLVDLDVAVDATSSTSLAPACWYCRPRSRDKYAGVAYPHDPLTIPSRSPHDPFMTPS